MIFEEIDTNLETDIKSRIFSDKKYQKSELFSYF